MWFSLWRQKSDILSVHGPPIPLSTYSRFSGSIGVTRGHGGPSKGDAWTVKTGNKCQKLTSRSFFYLIWLYGGELFGRKLWIVKMLKVYTKLYRYRLLEGFQHDESSVMTHYWNARMLLVNALLIGLDAFCCNSHQNRCHVTRL